MPPNQLADAARNLAHGLGIPVYIRDGRLYQHGPRLAFLRPSDTHPTVTCPSEGWRVRYDDQLDVHRQIYAAMMSLTMPSRPPTRTRRITAGSGSRKGGRASPAMWDAIARARPAASFRRHSLERKGDTASRIGSSPLETLIAPRGTDGSNPASSSGEMIWGRRRRNGTIVAAL